VAKASSSPSPPPPPPPPLIVDKNGVNYIWRRIKVSGGMPLDVLVDKVLEPAMGWER